MNDHITMCEVSKEKEVSTQWLKPKQALKNYIAKVPGVTQVTLVLVTGLSLAGLHCIMARFGPRSMETVVMASRCLLGAANWPVVCTRGSSFIEGALAAVIHRSRYMQEV